MMAAFSGAALGLSGLLMQTYFRNPLAGPSVLGVSSGATLGVAMVALGGASLGWASRNMGMGSQVLGALLGGGAVMVLLGLVMGRFRSMTALLIFGLMVGYLTGALVTVLQAGADAGGIASLCSLGDGVIRQWRLVILRLHPGSALGEHCMDGPHVQSIGHVDHGFLDSPDHGCGRT